MKIDTERETVTRNTPKPKKPRPKKPKRSRRIISSDPLAVLFVLIVLGFLAAILIKTLGGDCSRVAPKRIDPLIKDCIENAEGFGARERCIGKVKEALCE